METAMFVNPCFAARIVKHHRADMEARAYNQRRRREALSMARLAKTRIPSRLPRHWRIRYL
jgi:hypothetical protein